MLRRILASGVAITTLNMAVAQDSTQAPAAPALTVTGSAICITNMILVKAVPTI